MGLLGLQWDWCWGRWSGASFFAGNFCVVDARARDAEGKPSFTMTNGVA